MDLGISGRTAAIAAGSAGLGLGAAKALSARRKQSDIVDVHHLGVLVVLILRNFSFYPLRNVDIARRIIHSSQRPGAPVPELDV